MAKRTPLYSKHLELGGKIVEFAGFELPVQYTSVIAEHNAVRNNAGLFDVSHMGEFYFSGRGAETALNRLLSNDITNMYDGQIKYSLLTNYKGGAVDDVLVHRENQNLFCLVVNGANVQKDEKWVLSNLTDKEVLFENKSEFIAQIALQGPKSQAILEVLVAKHLIPEKYYTFKSNVNVGGILTTVSRTGYTAEDGFEFYCKTTDAVALYDILLKAGEKFGVVPCGLGARDTLRLEGGMPLYGHELNDDFSIDETGLNFAIKMSKADFIGKKYLQNHLPEYERLGAEVTSRGIVRESCKVYADGLEVGIVTSGNFSPTLQKAICMIRLKKGYENSKLTADVRGKLLDIEIVKLPFYKCVK